MREIGEMEKNQEQENTPFQWEIFMRDNGKEILNMEEVNLYTLLELLLKENGIMIKS